MADTPNQVIIKKPGSRKYSRRTHEETLSQKFTPPDIIAIIVILGGLYATIIGKGDTFGPLLLAVVAFYFGMKTPPANPA